MKTSPVTQGSGSIRIRNSGLKSSISLRNATRCGNEKNRGRFAENRIHKTSVNLTTGRFRNKRKSIQFIDFGRYLRLNLLLRLGSTSSPTIRNQNLSPDPTQVQIRVRSGVGFRFRIQKLIILVEFKKGFFSFFFVQFRRT